MIGAGYVEAAMVAGLSAVRAPLPPTLNCPTTLPFHDPPYTWRPSGETAPVCDPENATLAGVIGVSSPPAPIEN